MAEYELPAGYITADAARDRLKITKQRMATLLRDGALTYKRFPRDQRIKLVAIADVERLERELNAAVEPEEVKGGVLGKSNPAAA